MGDPRRYHFLQHTSKKSIFIAPTHVSECVRHARGGRRGRGVCVCSSCSVFRFDSVQYGKYVCTTRHDTPHPSPALDGTRRRTGATDGMGSFDRVVVVVDERARLLTERDDAGGDGDGDGGRGGGGGRARGVRAAGRAVMMMMMMMMTMMMGGVILIRARTRRGGGTGREDRRQIAPECDRATLAARLAGWDAAGERGTSAARELDVTFVNGLWFIPGPPGAEHHPREWYERASGTTAWFMGALGARSAFARGTREECENVAAMYRGGANFNDTNVPGSYRMYGARSVDKVTCVVKPVDELPLRPECGDAPYRVAWLNKVPVLREVAETMDRGGGYENVRSSNYFWLDADMAAPGDAHWQWDSFNTAEQMTRNLAAAETGISPACYHGSWNFSRPILGACDNVGDILANVFGGSLDSVRYFDQKYRDFVRRWAPTCPREEWVFAKMAAREYRADANGAERPVFSKRSCLYEDPNIGPETIVRDGRCFEQTNEFAARARL